KRLGVRRQTIDKMVKGMEEKGLVWRDRDPDDRRRCWVNMTTYGLERFLEAMKWFIRTGWLRRRFDAMHARGRAFVRRAAEMAKHVGRALRDTAHHYYSGDAPDAVAISRNDTLDAKVRFDVERLEKHRPASADATFDELDSEAELNMSTDEWEAESAELDRQ